MAPIRPGAQANVAISAVRAVRCAARLEIALAKRIGFAVKCRAAA
jgi:hypothetical protein